MAEEINKDTSSNGNLRVVEIWVLIVTMFVVAWGNHRTAQLVSLEQGPNISVSDVQLVYIDDTNTIVRTTSWRNGTPKEETHAIEKNAKVVLTLRFNNYGRYPGFVQLVEHPYDNQIVEAHSAEHAELVSPNLETGDLFNTPLLLPVVVNVMASTSPIFILDLQYVFRFYDQNKKIIGDNNVTIRCEMFFLPVAGGVPGSVVSCRPIVQISPDNSTGNIGGEVYPSFEGGGDYKGILQLWTKNPETIGSKDSLFRIQAL